MVQGPNISTTHQEQLLTLKYVNLATSVLSSMLAKITVRPNIRGKQLILISSDLSALAYLRFSNSITITNTHTIIDMRQMFVDNELLINTHMTLQCLNSCSSHTAACIDGCNISSTIT